jgi:UDP-N-acetylglucosamine 2-epimerase (non-hydrolysing)
MIDTLLRYRQHIDDQNITDRFGVAPRNYALLTLHRPSNVDVKETLSGILDALADIQKKLPVLFPLHPRTRQRIVETGLFERARDLANLKLLEPLGYMEFLGLMAQAKLVMTDSGGIQEETTILEIPCLTLRENTERPVTITEGTNELVGSQAERIIEGVLRILDGKKGNSQHPELWDGHAAERIVKVLRGH